ncbi:MAG: hypothetical protein IJ223_05500 [Clostridia bacterium]|nr:hypothetical protein [Clostridia bacterium]
MKVLFAVSNESVSEAIVKQYQKDYKEIISYKNVYYFNAILKEIQKDKSYNRIVISEDLEPFANNNYDTIDRFLFEKLDSISDESSDVEGTDIPIILISTDRRAKGDSILLKLFSIGVYNAIIGPDRNIEEVCRLINKPRTKKDAKVYYKIEAEDASYQAENEENVNEVEIQNIITHYKKLGKNEDRYVDSFNNIASQYTDQQLKVIIKFLPLNVKAVLEAESPKYQELMTFTSGKKKAAVSMNPRNAYTPLDNMPEEKEKTKKEKKEKGFKAKPKKEKEPNVEDINLDILDTPKAEENVGKNFIVPNAFDSRNVKQMNEDIDSEEETDLKFNIPDENKEENEEQPIDLFDLSDEDENEVMNKLNDQEELNDIPEIEEAPKKRRGRPKKVLTEEEQAELERKKATPKRRGRPKKQVETTEQEEPEDLFNLSNDDSNEEDEPVDLFELSDEENEKEDNDDAVDLFNLSDDEESENIIDEIEDSDEEPKKAVNSYENEEEDYFLTTNKQPQVENLSNLLTNDKKIVAFVGAPKNGTSFLVNNLAAMLSESGIDTAILDLTKNKNAYYIYTKNEESLRKISYECMKKLKNGVAQGIPATRTLTVYTALPTNVEESDEDVNMILQTLATRHSLVLIDADFDTPAKYFQLAQEIYLVQSMDILTIQPLTAFLRDLKSKHVLDSQKLRIVINKELRVKSLSPKVLIGGMAYYNEPAMTFMTELFDKDKVKYCTIPFEIENYSRYLEELVDCEISTKGYTKVFMSNLKNLADMVYPLLNKQSYGYNGSGVDYSKANKGRNFFGN